MDIYDEMILASKRIACAFPEPRFYESCAREISRSRELFEETPLMARTLSAVERDFARNDGHGLDHALTVSVEAGALVLAEGPRTGLDPEEINNAAVLARIAGLLHDMRRTDHDHAKAGAEASAALLEALGIPEIERLCVARAIAGHEAFADPPAAISVMERLVGDALYDADKFRWGPDNFTVTLWEMLRFRRASVPAVISRFPEGMEGIRRIRETFRSETGKTFGPEFIDLGLEMGRGFTSFSWRGFAGSRTKQTRQIFRGRARFPSPRA